MYIRLLHAAQIVAYIISPPAVSGNYAQAFYRIGKQGSESKAKQAKMPFEAAELLLSATKAWAARRTTELDF